jgi:hypothetical protein
MRVNVCHSLVDKSGKRIKEETGLFSGESR